MFSNQNNMFQITFFTFLILSLVSIIENQPNPNCLKITCFSNAPNSIAIGDSLAYCPKDEICNKNTTTNCDTPCVPKICKNILICIDNAPSFYLLDNNLKECSNNQICNKEYNTTCAFPCVDKTTTTTTTTVATTTTKSSINSINCNYRPEEEPCRKSTNPLFYYKCKQILWFYVPKIHSCSKIDDDYTCRNTDVCK